MKKLIMAALTILAVLAFSVTAMAGAINNDSSNVVFGGEATYDMSNKVYVDYTQDANNQKFGIGTVHAGGNRQFATSSETSVIFWKTCAKGTTDALVGNASWTTGQYAGASGWSAL